MTVHLVCTCGRKLKAPDHLLGKSARCPQCGKVLTVQATSAAADRSLHLQANAEAAQVGAATTLPPALPPGGKPAKSTALHALHTSAQRGREQYEPKVYGNLLGIELTLTKLIVLGVLALGLGGVVLWYYNGPAKNFRVVSVELVDVYTAIPQFTELQPMSLGQLGGNPALGMQAPAGWKNKPGQPQLVTEEIYGFGGGEGASLVLTRSSPAGQFILVRAKVKQSFLADMGLQGGYDLSFRSDKFVLQTSAGPVQGRLLSAHFEAGAVQVEMAEGSQTDYARLYPADVKPSREQFERYGDFPVSGQVEFDALASGAVGSFEFSVPKVLNDGLGPAMIAMGKLSVSGRMGMDVHFDYQGGAAMVSWNPGTSGWYAQELYRRREHFSPFHKWEVVILYPKPSVPGPYRLMMDQKKLATLPATITGHAPVLTANATATPAASPAAGSPSSAGSASNVAGAGGASGASTSTAGDSADSSAANPATAVAAAVGTGATAAAPTAPPEPVEAESPAATDRPADDPNPLTAYLSALANARKQGQALVATSNIHQLTTAVLLYAEQNHGEMPDDFNDLAYTVPGISGLLKNPRTGENPGFIYVKPAEKFSELKNPSQTPIVHESRGGKIDPKGAVGYADGHVEQ